MSEVAVVTNATGDERANPLAGKRAKGQAYLEFLADMHGAIAPDWYLEVGTQTGKSLLAADCACVSVDPEFTLKHEIMGAKPGLMLFQDTSDRFFESGFLDRLGVRFDLAFLDGMHLYEYLLRDFMNAEGYMAKGGTVVMLDCLPFEPSMAERDRRNAKTRAWTGDVWKVIPILREFRPDLEITLYDAAPTGLTIIRNLDPGNRVLRDRYDEIISKYDAITDVTEQVGAFEVVPTDRSPWKGGALSKARAPRRMALPAPVLSAVPSVSSGAVAPVFPTGDGPLSFVIQTAAPNARVMPNWGDYFFAKGLAEALQRQGHKARIQARNRWTVSEAPGEIDIVLRGRAEYARRGTTPTLYWVISGGEHVPRPELEQADHVFVAGQRLAERWSRQVGADKVSVMWQAFDAARMPMPPERGKRSGIVFVGIARKLRPIVQIAMQTRYSLKIWGNGWRETDAAKYVVADRIDNDDLGRLYAGAEIVLNDQTRIMRKAGLVSNRIFDALACGAAVITTPTGGLPEEFAPFVTEVATPEEFTEAVRAIRAETDAQRTRRNAFARTLRDNHSFDARAAEFVAKVIELRDVRLAAE
jgi:hypothetical protein